MGNLSAAALSLLQEQYRHETSNSLRYFARASWARFRGFEATADFFQREAGGERKHALKVQSWIEDRNEQLIPEPYSYNDPSAFVAFTDLFSSALGVERLTTAMLNTIYAQALSDADYQLVTQVSELVIEQIEEENLYQTILDRIASRGSDAASAHDIDVWIGEQYRE
jgi:ferritin